MRKPLACRGPRKDRDDVTGYTVDVAIAGFVPRHHEPSEALIRIDCDPPLPSGLLALGQRADLSLDARHGSELLMFLGRSLAAMIRKWLTTSQA